MKEWRLCAACGRVYEPDDPAAWCRCGSARHWGPVVAATREEARALLSAAGLPTTRRAPPGAPS